MESAGAVFLDLRLPNATTWLYVSSVLAAVFFFQFGRVFGLRNWDLLLLFSLAPGMLFLEEALERQAAYRPRVAAVLPNAASMVLSACPIGESSCVVHLGFLARAGQAVPDSAAAIDGLERADRSVFAAYLWLVAGSGVLMLRSLLDLGLTRRLPFTANLSVPSLALAASALLIALSARTFSAGLDSVSFSESRSVIVERAADAALQAAANAELHPAPEIGLTQAEMVTASLAEAGHLLVVLGLLWIGARHLQSPLIGLSAAVLYLLLPYTGYHARDLDHVLPAAILTLAVAMHRWPTVSGLLLGLGSGAVYFPLLLLPLWASYYRGRGMGRFLAAFGLAFAAVLLVLLLDESLRPLVNEALSRPDWQAWDPTARPKASGLWTGVEMHYAYRAPLFIAYLVLVVGSSFLPFPKRLFPLIAWSAALVIGVQLWYADAGGVYVLWYLPLAILIALRPPLADQPLPLIDPERDWLRRCLHAGGRLLVRALAGGSPQPMPATSSPPAS